MSESDNKMPLKDKLKGLGQELIGEIEIVGGVLTGDPNTEAEGEFNAQVGRIKEDLTDPQPEEKSGEESR